MSNDTQGISTRRKFLGMAGMMGAGAVLSGCTQVIAQEPTPVNLDPTILNFALNLEYLEAAFYLAAVGRLSELTDAGGDHKKVTLPDGFPGVVPGLTGDMLAMAHEIADDELAHVKFLRGALGAAAVSQPQLDLGGAFAAAGEAASGGAIKGFNPFAGELFFLHGAFIFEDVGVTAYKGAARLITDRNPNGVLEQAAGILAVEAYHAGSVRTQLYRRRGEQVTPSLKVGDVVQAISNLRDGADGDTDLDQGVTAGAGNPGHVLARSANIVPTDANGIAFSRTPRQVANIVFLSPGATKGGFFPQGLSGSFGAIL